MMEANLISHDHVVASVSAMQVMYSWASSSNSWNNTVVPGGYNSKTLIIPGPVPAVQDGDLRFVTLTAFLKNHNTTQVVIPITLTAVGTPLVAALKAPSGDVKSTATIRLNASASSDPDDPSNASPLMYTFSCAIVGSVLPCVNGALGNKSLNTWNIPVSQLTIGKQYILTVTVSKGERTANRHQQAAFTAILVGYGQGKTNQVDPHISSPSYT
jgi:hypothetical protein